MRELARRIKHELRRFGMSREEHRHNLVGSRSLWREKREFQFRFLTSRGLEPGHTLLDLGCGTLRGGIPLIRYLDEGHYAGLESRAHVLAEGRKELREAGLEHKRPVLSAQRDVTAHDLGDMRFDFAWAYSVLIHMSDGVLDNALGWVAPRLRTPGGVFYANVNIGDRRDGKWRGFPVVRRPLDFYRQRCAEAGLAMTDLGPIRRFDHPASGGADAEMRMLEMRPA